MPPSQLKQLKASLREKGITGPPQKKRKKNQRSQDADGRARRNEALSEIRETFNPFEAKSLSRPKKFHVTTRQTNGTNARTVVGRPGLSKRMGEDTRRETLLAEMKQRRKSGGIIDRRIGENNPHMTPDEMMLERFTREKSRRKGAGLFDLEGDEDEEQLTHFGRSLGLDKPDTDAVEDYDAASVEMSSDGEEDSSKRKRRRPELDAVLQLEENESGQPERKKSKAEVMKEVMAKSKLHKYERQQQREEDMDLREEIDLDLQETMDVLRAFRSNKQPSSAAQTTHTDGNIQNNGVNGGANIDKEYDARVRQLAQEQRAKPSERTKTEEEKATEEAERLRKLEGDRLKRMRGEEEEVEVDEEELDPTDDYVRDDAADFGLGAAQPSGKLLEVEDEDEFLIDDNLVADQSDNDDEGSSEADSDEQEDEVDLEDDEFVHGLLSREDEGRDGFKIGGTKPATNGISSSELPYTYPCPQSLDELLGVVTNVTVADHPTVVQRIRALYQPQLHQDNKPKLMEFSRVLVRYIFYMAENSTDPSLKVLEALIRHIHSLSRMFPSAIAEAFRIQLHDLKINRGAELTSGFCVILTAIGSIYPTSDHFHQVVTPAVTIMAWWLEIKNAKTAKNIATGAFIGALCLKYQSYSKRYIPELLRFTKNALISPAATPELREAHLTNLRTMADLWSGKTAFIEMSTPDLVTALESLPKSGSKQSTLLHLRVLLQQAQSTRRPLQLHHHKPLPIKTSIPKFEDNFHPDKHYDPDHERAEATKVRKEFKRERKGALRELRKDANFMAREALKEKKERDRAYEEKYRKLLNEIQGEEGAAANEYEREKRARKGRR